MKTAVLKRLDSLEAAAKVRRRPPLALIDVGDLGDDRDRYWARDVHVLDRYVPRSDQPSEITAVVVTVHEARRATWERTRHLDDDQLEADAERRVRPLGACTVVRHHAERSGGRSGRSRREIVHLRL